MNADNDNEPTSMFLQDLDLLSQPPQSSSSSSPHHPSDCSKGSPQQQLLLLTQQQEQVLDDQSALSDNHDDIASDAEFYTSSQSTSSPHQHLVGEKTATTSCAAGSSTSSLPLLSAAANNMSTTTTSAAAPGSIRKPTPIQQHQARTSDMRLVDDDEDEESKDDNHRLECSRKDGPLATTTTTTSAASSAITVACSPERTTSNSYNATRTAAADNHCLLLMTQPSFSNDDSINDDKDDDDVVNGRTADSQDCCNENDNLLRQAFQQSSSVAGEDDDDDDECCDTPAATTKSLAHDLDETRLNLDNRTMDDTTMNDARDESSPLTMMPGQGSYYPDNFDDDSSSSSSSEGASSTSTGTAAAASTTTGSLKGKEYMAFVEENKKRNKRRLALLGFGSAQKAAAAAPQAGTPESAVVSSTLNGKVCKDILTTPPPTGMLLEKPPCCCPIESQRRNGKESPLTISAARDATTTTTTTTFHNIIDDLYEQFPHREAQIKLLVSLIGTAMGQAVFRGNDDDDEKEPFVPAPIFVSGPSGSGKTSVVRSVVRALQRWHFSQPKDGSDEKNQTCILETAYVNCAAIEPTSVEAVLEDAYNQLVPTETPKRRTKTKQGPSKNRKRKTDPTCGLLPTKHLKTDTDADVALNPPQRLVNDGICVQSNDAAYTSDMEDEMEDKLEALKVELTQEHEDGDRDSDADVALPTRRQTRQSINGTANRKRQNEERGVPETQGKSIRKVESVTASHGAPVAFGRVIAPFFGPPSSSPNRTKPGSAVLVLDHAERLFTLSANQKVESNNFLAQLLLLPPVMRLNLTIVIVSRSSLLDRSRINNSASVQKSLGTIANGLHPVRVHFPAYKGKAVFRTILKHPSIIELVVGRQHQVDDSSRRNDTGDKFRLMAIDSFIETVVQSLSSVTRDVREMIRLGRALWATYILPLDPSRIRSTLESARSRAHKRRLGPKNTKEIVSGNTENIVEMEEVQKELLAILDEAIFPRIKQCLDDDLFVLNGDDTNGNMTTPQGSSSAPSASQHDLPFLSKCLLLAAFVCQNNKPDKDKALFTIQKNGKKNSRQGHRSGKNDADGIAYGSTTWEQQRLKMLRPRTFPLERMLSVFVNLVGLIGGEEKLLSLSPAAADKQASSLSGGRGRDNLLSAIGSTCFFENLARLREIGLLHEVQGPTITGGGGGSATYGFTSSSSFVGINMTTTKYWCELNRDDADALAASVEFALENFLL